MFRGLIENLTYHLAPTRSTRQRVFKMLRDRRNQRIPVNHFTRKGLIKYNQRISEIRKKGYFILNVHRIDRKGDGRSNYMLVTDRGQALRIVNQLPTHNLRVESTKKINEHVVILKDKLEV